MRHTALSIVLLAALTAACKATTQPESPCSYCGMYVLTRVNGIPVPCMVTDTGTVRRVLLGGSIYMHRESFRGDWSQSPVLLTDTLHLPHPPCTFVNPFDDLVNDLDAAGSLSFTGGYIEFAFPNGGFTGLIYGDTLSITRGLIANNEIYRKLCVAFCS